jgi:uncharacterized protein YkwD
MTIVPARRAGAALLFASSVAVSCGGSRASSTGAEPGGDFAALTSGEARAPDGDAPPAGDMQAILEAHNRYRAAHCAPPLAWSNDVAKVAAAWADRLAKTKCGLEHSQNDLGENLAGGTASALGPERAVDIWYAEKKNYDFAHGGFSMSAGHFTQLVWKGSRHLGCGTSTCKDVRIWVCNYDPPGNVEGEFAANVAPAGCASR